MITSVPLLKFGISGVHFSMWECTSVVSVRTLLTTQTRPWRFKIIWQNVSAPFGNLLLEPLKRSEAPCGNQWESSWQPPFLWFLAQMCSLRRLGLCKQTSDLQLQSTSLYILLFLFKNSTNRKKRSSNFVLLPYKYECFRFGVFFIVTQADPLLG